MVLMDSEALYRTLANLAATMPDFQNPRTLSRDDQQWLGRAAAAIEEVGDLSDKVAFAIQAGNIGDIRFHGAAVRQIGVLLHRALARAELSAPTAVQGSFVPVGHQFDALVALGKVLDRARNEVMIVDPYMDISALSEFCPLVTSGVPIRLLTDQHGVKPNLRPAVAAWKLQHGDSKPLEARATEPKLLHDRLILLDQSEAWILTQSLKDFAARSPGSITQADATSAELKINYYAGLWNISSAID